jgi:hypothetical protein
MMGIVHDALRRDLDRAITSLTSEPLPNRARRAAIDEHVVWMMRFLHDHHAGEDAGLWPLLRTRDQALAPLLEAMEADHARIRPLLERCTEAAQDDTRVPNDTHRSALVQALVRLRDDLLPHLRREEDELMPLASIAVTDAEWRAVDRQYFIAPKSKAELGFEGHWLLDGLDAERTQVAVHQVPPIARFVLLHGFRRRYRAHAIACWGAPPDRGRASRRRAYAPSRAMRREIPRSACVETVVPAPIEAVWSVLTDVTRVPEWSRECRRVEWLGGAIGAAPGARFRGTNKAGPWTWSRVNEVVVADEPHAFVWRTVSTLRFPDCTEWRVDLEDSGDGTRIVQSYRVVRAPAAMSRLYALLVPTHRGRGTELAEDLRRLGQLAEAERHSVPAARAVSALGQSRLSRAPS